MLFKTKKHPLTDYIWLPDYPNNYKPYSQLCQVYLRVGKNKRQILVQEIRRDLPQFFDEFVKVKGISLCHKLIQQYI